MSLLKFLKSTNEGGRLVSTGDLTELQISEARVDNRLFVDDQSGLGWALLPWSLTTTEDRKRQAEIAESVPLNSPAGLTLEQSQFAVIFNEWARRCSEDPDSFTDVLDEDGNPVEDYGQESAVYFTQIREELMGKGMIIDSKSLPSKTN